MNFNALIAEPGDAAWAAIASGIRRHCPEASLLRVKDGEQALRFLFQRGLLSEAAEIPDLVVLAAELPLVSAERVFARLRQDSRTRAVPVIIRWHDVGETRVDIPELLLAQDGLLFIRGPDAIEGQVAEAVRRLCAQTPSCEVEEAEWLNPSTDCP